MANEIKILVRTQNSAKAGFEAVDRELDTFAKTSSEKFSKTFSENFTKNFTETITTHLRTVGDQVQQSANQSGNRIGDTIGQRISERVRVHVDESITRDIDGRLADELGRAFHGGGNDHVSVSDRNRDTVHVNVDVDKQSLLSKIGGIGKDAGSKFSDGFGGVMSTFFSGDFITLILKAVGGGGLAFLLAGPIGAAISSAVLVGLGGGALGLGIAGALNAPSVKGAIADFKNQIGEVFGTFGKKNKSGGSFSAFFEGPLIDFMHMFGQVLGTLKPMLDDIGRTLAPVADQLAHGVIGFLQNVLPAIGRAIKAAAPLISTLAEELPDIGDAMGRFFDHISKGAPNANVFFNDLLNVIPIVIRVLGILIEAFTQMYTVCRDIFFDIMSIAADWAVAITSSARIAFGWIPGLGPKLDTAAHKAAQFKEKVNKQLNGIHDVDVQVKIRVAFGNVWAQIGDLTARLQQLGVIHKAVGGAVGRAASGGARANLTWVGEEGPELIDVAPGSQVHTAGDSRRMASQGAGGPVIITPVIDKSGGANRELIDVLMRTVRFEIGQQFGGDVQAGLGF